MRIKIYRSPFDPPPKGRKGAKYRKVYEADTLEDAARILREAGVPLDPNGRLAEERGYIVEIIGKFATAKAQIVN